MLAQGQEPRCQGYRRKFILHSRGVNVRVADIVQRWDEMVRVSLGVRRGAPRRARRFSPRNHRRRIVGDHDADRHPAHRGPRKSASARPGRTLRIAAAAGIFGSTLVDGDEELTVVPLTRGSSSAPIEGEQSPPPSVVIVS